MLILYLINRRITYTTNILINKVEELIPEKLLKINKPTNKTVIIKKMFQIYLPFYKNSFHPSNLSESLYSFSNKNTKDSTKKVIAKKQTTNSRKYLYFPSLQNILSL